MDTTLTAADPSMPTATPAETNAPQNFAQLERPWTWRDRLRYKLMPRRFCQLPKAPARFEDVIETHVIVGLDWPDRLRVLLTGHLRVDTRIVAEHKVGATVSASVAYPIRKRNAAFED